MVRPVVVLALTLGLWSCASEEAKEKRASGGAAGTDAGLGGGGGGPPDAGPRTVPAFDAVRIQSDSALPNFQRASTNVDFGEPPFADARLIVDLSTTCFPFDTWKDNPPPAGQNWPKDCDAFDRNFEILLDPPQGSAGPPALELMRAITPFGGPMHLEIDVTDVLNARPGKHQVDVSIGTWSDPAGAVTGSAGGWNVSARFELVPGAAPRKVLGVVPLFDGSDTGATLAAIPFEVPAGTASTRIEYRVTGHGAASAGGCGGPAEEFCIRTHDIYVDGKLAQSVQPWRDDCATLCTLAHQDNSSGGFDYCKENPCGAIQSVKAPRANWCPGSLTPPFVWALPELTSPGAHDFSWKVDEIASGGSWRVSAAFFAFAP